MTIQELINKAEKNGFEIYLDCPHPDLFEHPKTNCIILTCINGKYDGQVIDGFYNYHTGIVTKVSMYSQHRVS